MFSSKPTQICQFWTLIHLCFATITTAVAVAQTTMTTTTTIDPSVDKCRGSLEKAIASRCLSSVMRYTHANLTQASRSWPLPGELCCATTELANCTRLLLKSSEPEFHVCRTACEQGLADFEQDCLGKDDFCGEYGRRLDDVYDALQACEDRFSENVAAAIERAAAERSKVGSSHGAADERSCCATAEMLQCMHHSVVDGVPMPPVLTQSTDTFLAICPSVGGDCSVTLVFTRPTTPKPGNGGRSLLVGFEGRRSLHWYYIASVVITLVTVLGA